MKFGARKFLKRQTATAYNSVNDRWRQSRTRSAACAIGILRGGFAVRSGIAPIDVLLDGTRTGMVAFRLRGGQFTGRGEFRSGGDRHRPSPCGGGIHGVRNADLDVLHHRVFAKEGWIGRASCGVDVDDADLLVFVRGGGVIQLSSNADFERRPTGYLRWAVARSDSQFD